MRMTTLLSVAVLGVSTAALAQVSTTPQGNAATGNSASANAAPDDGVVEDKVPPANMMDTPSGNSADAAPPAGEPEGSTSAPPRG